MDRAKYALYVTLRRAVIVLEFSNQRFKYLFMNLYRNILIFYSPGLTDLIKRTREATRVWTQTTSVGDKYSTTRPIWVTIQHSELKLYLQSIFNQNHLILS